MGDAPSAPGESTDTKECVRDVQVPLRATRPALTGGWRTHGAAPSRGRSQD